MLCPFCSYENSKVLESRTTTDKTSIRRRRECERCQKRFTTYERAEKMPVLVIKRDGSREDFSREKLLNSVKKACHKCDISYQQIEEFVESIENELANIGRREISSNILGKLILDNLKELEEVAYVRYSSIYNKFNCVEDFVEIAINLKKSPD
ncbi:MAG: transcriptional regulator NrdR [Cyanobacteriota bacterium]